MSLRRTLSTFTGILAVVAGFITLVLGVFFTAGVDPANSHSASAAAAGPYVFLVGVLWTLPNALLVKARLFSLTVYLFITGTLIFKFLLPIPSEADASIGFQGCLAVAIIIAVSCLPWVSLALRTQSLPGSETQSAV